MSLLLAAGCHRDEVKVYRVAKDQDQPQQQTAPALPTDSPNPSLPPGHPDISSAPAASLPAASASALPQLTWKTPEGWTEVPPSEMRVASFKVTGAERQTGGRERHSPARHGRAATKPMSTAGAARSVCHPCRRRN